MNARTVVYFDKLNGKVLWYKAYNRSLPFDFEHDYNTVKELNAIFKDKIEIFYSDIDYTADFAIATDYRVNPETKELEFSYPDPNAPQEPQPYQKPLSQEVKDLRMEVARSNTEMFEMMIMMSGGGM